MMAAVDPTGSARRASSLYDEAYARRYRAHDEAFPSSVPSQDLADWLHRVCTSCPPPIDILDLGCGTGRYFWALGPVRRLVGVDASAPMLAHARHPYRETDVAAESITLIEGDLLGVEFPRETFDVVYSVGVLAEHAPLTGQLVEQVHEWLRGPGRFAFTAVHPDSPSIPKTLKRRIARAAAPLTPGAAGRALRDRLLARGMYADEAFITRLAEGLFDIEQMDRFTSEAHDHVRVVLRKRVS